MIEFLLGLILNASLSAVKSDGSQLDPRSRYYNSCLHGTEKFLSLRYPQSPQKEILKVTQKDCDELMAFVDGPGVWEKADNPDRDGCWDSIKLNLKDKEPDEIQENQKRICTQK